MRIVKCIREHADLIVGALYEVSCDNYDLIHIKGMDGYRRDVFEYVHGSRPKHVYDRRRTMTHDRTPRYAK